MGIDVSAQKVVTINDQHQNGVDTSIEGNPSGDRLKGLVLLHVFNRNQRGLRRDDGNPLIHALKGRRGFSILPFWKGRVMAQARAILTKAAGQLQGYDFCMPLPSSSGFCMEFAQLVSQVSGAPILPPTFLRKRLVGELLAESQAAAPKMRPGLKGLFTSQLYAWEQMDPAAPYQAKDVDVGLRLLFTAFALDGQPPVVKDKRILLVDDVFASGSSLLSVREILQSQLGASVSGVCFLSGV